MVNAQDFTPSTSSDSGLTPNVNVGTPDVHSIEGSLKDMHVNGGELESFESQMLALHKASAEGDVNGVRAVLSKNLNVLESINPQTGLTAMLCAIYGGQHATVRELAMAGAYPPPPTVTNDPSILAILYPPPPPPPQHQMQPPPPQHHHAQHISRGAPFSPSGGRPSFGAQQQSGGSPEESGKVNLPPAEVSRNIPCRNYPNCRYGDACAFHHPGPVANGAAAGAANGGAFYPTPFASEFVPMGPPGAAGAGMFYPGMAPSFPQHAGFAGHHFPGNGNGAPNGGAGGHRRRPSEVPAAVQQQSQAPAPIAEEGSTDVAVAAEEQQGEAKPAGDEQQQQSSTDAEAQTGNSGVVDGQQQAQTSATQPPAPRGAAAAAANGFPPVRHHKKMSFSGAKNGGPWLGPMAANARAAVLGTWINGHPPPCAFFQQNKCRNGEMCKFPHILPDGTDCRHPDVISGAVPPVSHSGPGGRVPRARLSMSANGQFERLPHHAALKGSQAHAQAQAAAAAAARANAASQQNGSPAPVTGETAKDGKAEGAAAAAAAAPTPSDAKKPAPAAIVAPAATRGQSASRSAPNTRSASPAQHNNGFRPERVNGHHQAKRIPNGPQAQGGRSSSPKQRIPSADDFPALAGSTGSLSSSAVLKPIQDGKTAAQVLSAPAPPKPVPTKAESSSAESGELVRVRSNESNANVTTVSEDDAVLVSHTPVSTEAKSAPRAPISFAAAIANSKAPESTATVALQA